MDGTFYGDIGMDENRIIGKVCERYTAQPVPRFWDYKSGELITICIN